MEELKSKRRITNIDGGIKPSPIECCIKVIFSKVVISDLLFGETWNDFVIDYSSSLLDLFVQFIDNDTMNYVTTSIVSPCNGEPTIHFQNYW